MEYTYFPDTGGFGITLRIDHLYIHETFVPLFLAAIDHFFICEGNVRCGTRVGRVLVHYVCQGSLLSEGDLKQRTIVAAPGRISWHVVGGVAPYTPIESYIENGVVHVTVVDAAGNIAQGSALIRVRDEVVFRKCKSWDEGVPEEELTRIRNEEYLSRLASSRASGDSNRKGLSDRVLISNNGKGGTGRTLPVYRTTVSERPSGHRPGGTGSGGNGPTFIRQAPAKR